MIHRWQDIVDHAAIGYVPLEEQYTYRNTFHGRSRYSEYRLNALHTTCASTKVDKRGPLVVCQTSLHQLPHLLSAMHRSAGLANEFVNADGVRDGYHGGPARTVPRFNVRHFSGSGSTQAAD